MSNYSIAKKELHRWAVHNWPGKDRWGKAYLLNRDNETCQTLIVCEHGFYAYILDGFIFAEYSKHEDRVDRIIRKIIPDCRYYKLSDYDFNYFLDKHKKDRRPFYIQFGCSKVNGILFKRIYKSMKNPQIYIPAQSQFPIMFCGSGIKAILYPINPESELYKRADITDYYMVDYSNALATDGHIL